MFAQIAGDFIVERCQARARIDNKHSRIGAFKACLCLLAHAAGEAQLVLVFPTGCVYDCEK